jgi:hypothetical protein
MRGWTIYILAVCITYTCQGQITLPPKQPSSFSVLQIHSGHSLTDPLFHPHWPGQYVNLMTQVLGQWAEPYIGKSTIPGSPMWWRWENPPCCGAPDARHDIGDWELLSITEGVPLFYEGGGTQDWYQDAIISQREHLSMFANNAWENGNDGNGAPTLLWTTWTNIDDSDGPWRPMLDIQGQEWENMQDYANDNLLPGSPPVYIIPGHKMMARLYDDIQDGLVPDITDISDFFSDNIHTNELGAYAIAMIHYACIFNTSPIGLPNNLLPGAPSGTPIPSPELATYLQNMIWEEVTSYPRTGIYQFLSVEVNRLEASYIHDQVKLSFELEELTDTEWIEIQHSANGFYFNTLERLLMNGNQTFQRDFIHDNPVDGVNYYRLKMVSTDGSNRYTRICSVKVVGNKFYLSPNPAKTFIRVNGDTISSLHVIIRDMQGKILLRNELNREISVGHLQPGMYLAEISDGITLHTVKLIIQR